MLRTCLKRFCAGLLAAATLAATCLCASAKEGAFPFQDVSQDAWYREAAIYCWYEDLFSGTGDTTFAPDTVMNRAMLVTVLYAMSGQPEVTAEWLPFYDVTEDAWYRSATAWAWENGVTSGTSETEFSPLMELPRQQLVTLLYQFAAVMGYDTSTRADLTAYADLDQLSIYALEPFQWAVSIGIISGTSADTLSPTGGSTRAQVAQILMQFCRYYGIFDTDVVIDLPVLMYHDISDQSTGSYTISIPQFADHLDAMTQAGYTPISLEVLLNYVYYGGLLPEHPVLITFDDGYLSNYLYAYPLLVERQIPAVFFAIGNLIGAETYKDTGLATIPHFTLEQAQEMTDSGLITIQSHTYDMHQLTGVDTEPVRNGVLPFDDECDEAFAAAVHQDCQLMQELLPTIPVALAYPYGHFSQLSEALLAQEGIQVTFTMEETHNTILRGDSASLYGLGRYNMSSDITTEDLLAILGQ